MNDSEKLPEDIKPTKWTITVGGNEWGVVKYDIVEYLRRRPKTRAATAIVGLLWMTGMACLNRRIQVAYRLVPGDFDSICYANATVVCSCLGAGVQAHFS